MAVITKLKGYVTKASIQRLLYVGLAVRLIMLCYSAWHDHTFRVKYTDIDYSVITDGAKEMTEGKSPFERATFRYTPLLSLLMIPNVLVWHHLGKFLFIGADLLAAHLVYTILLKSLGGGSSGGTVDGSSRATEVNERVAKLNVVCWILLNPIVINVSTRGNADMVITVMTLLVLHYFYQGQLVLASLWLGFATHFKMYPIIYAAPLVFGLLSQLVTQHHHAAPAGRSLLVGVVAPWLKKCVVCGVVTVLSFVAPTLLCGHFYGESYYFEAITYHFGRVDHRHNLSPYYYAAYLNMVPSAGGAYPLSDAFAKVEKNAVAAACKDSIDAIECYLPNAKMETPTDLGALANTEVEAQAVGVRYEKNGATGEQLKNTNWHPDQQGYGFLVAMAFFPQLAALMIASFQLRANVAHAFCIETLLFVAYNKVCTVQYFVWFIPFIPFILAEVMKLKSQDSQVVVVESRGLSSSTRSRGARTATPTRRSSRLASPSAAPGSPVGNSSDASSTVEQLKQLVKLRVALPIVLFWFGGLVSWMLVAVTIEFENQGSNFLALWVVCCVFYVAQMLLIVWLAVIAVKVQRLSAAGGGFPSEVVHRKAI